MCGIGGILRTDGKPIPEEWLDAIDARIAWRGPDGHGRFRDRVEIVDEQGQNRTVEVAFVHRRLSIIDHAGGHQPMVSERGRNDLEGLVAVVFNGCIYNHRELRRELEGRGHTFVTDHSDTEVLIHGWREWGLGLNSHLEGMYAYIVWDRPAITFALSRDTFGEKPLYRIEIFGHEPDSRSQILFVTSVADAVPLEVRRISDKGIARALQMGSPRLFTPGVIGDVAVTVGQGESMGVHGNGRRKWNTDQTKPAWHYGTVETEPDFFALLEEAVARRLEADVPLGCFLSGGIDSSLVTLLAKRHKPDVSTFTVRMPDPRYDESAFASTVAERLGTRHHTLDVSANPREDLVYLIETLGLPFGDSSILPTYWLSKAAREHVKVALCGDGGDELFLGYERYFVARRLARYSGILSHLPVGVLGRSHPKSLSHKVFRLREIARDFKTVGLAALEAVFTYEQVVELVGQPGSQLEKWDRSANDDPLFDLRCHDIHGYLPYDLLRKVDTASMACGLEVRCPFLDRDLARAALSAPIDQLMPGGQRKGLLRRIARKYLPREVVDRPKMGFAIPIGEWFRSDFGQMKSLLLDHLNSTDPFGSIPLKRKAVQRFIDEHLAGKRDHGQRLFTLLTLSIWARSQPTKAG